MTKASKVLNDESYMALLLSLFVDVVVLANVVLIGINGAPVEVQGDLL